METDLGMGMLEKPRGKTERSRQYLSMIVGRELDALNKNDILKTLIKALAVNLWNGVIAHVLSCHRWVACGFFISIVVLFIWLIL